MSEGLDLGCFSVSLAVHDLAASVGFYEKLGFTPIGGDDSYRMLANGTTVIGLFAGHIDETVLTFNPGLGQDLAQTSAVSDGDVAIAPSGDFTDVREIERHLKEQGVDLEVEVETEEGPAHIMLRDPDGHLILIDQFF